MNSRPLDYLASPYTPPAGLAPGLVAAIKEERFIQAADATAWLMTAYGINVFSPIVHSHPLHVHARMRGDWEFWKKVDTEYLSVSRRLIVLQLEGWDKSVGVQAEIQIAKEMGLPIYRLTVNTFPEDEPYTLLPL